MKHFRFLDDIAVADAAFEAHGKTYSDLFQSCANATITLMADPSTVSDTLTQKISLQHKDIERLLFNFLSELIYLKDAESMVFSSCSLTVEEKQGMYVLQATVKGAAIDPQKQALGNDVKAVTMHLFSITKEKDGYKAMVILDI